MDDDISFQTQVLVTTEKMIIPVIMAKYNHI